MKESSAIREVSLVVKVKEAISGSRLIREKSKGVEGLQSMESDPWCEGKRSRARL